jgi:hypothetical protein
MKVPKRLNRIADDRGVTNPNVRAWLDRHRVSFFTSH